MPSGEPFGVPVFTGMTKVLDLFILFAVERADYVGRVHRQLIYSDAGGVVYRVGDGREWRHYVGLTDSAHAEGVTGIRHFHYHSVYHRNVEAGGHTVVEQGGVEHLAIVAHVVFFVERPADSLNSAALYLAFDVGGMDCGPDVLEGSEPENFHLAGFRIHFEVNQVGGV